MTTIDIDPLLKRGISLLHSKSKDSAEQLRALLEEAQRQRHGKALSGVKDSFNFRRESPIPRAKQSSPSNVLLMKGNEHKRELSSKSRDEEVLLHIPKRPRVDSPHNQLKSHTPSPTPSLKSESSSRSRKSDESDSDPDMNDLAMEIGINCTVCKSFEQTSGNQLVECQECHSLYHQECHKPSVSQQDITDPRLVWYCAKCSRNLKKQSSTLVSSSSSIRASGSSGTGKSTSSSSSSLTSSSSSSRPSPSKSGTMSRPSPFTNLSSVSRTTVGSNSGSGSSSSSSGRSTLSSSASRANASAPPGANSLLNAERRVHLMKKKAAAKNAERRKI